MVLIPILLIGTYFWWRPHRAHAQTDVFSTSGSWVVPAGVSSATFEAWGGGGAGAGASSNGTGGGGGAGGQYAIKNLSGLVTSDSYTVTVAVAVSGTSGSGSAGGDTTVTSPSSTTVVLAKGGAGGTAAGAGGTGSTTGGVGDTVFRGGSGSAGSGSSATAGAGGGGAGSSGNGGDASGTTAGSGTTLNGGNGGTGGSGNYTGVLGSIAGGGGSGASKSNGGSRNGGTGAAGYVTVTYTSSDVPPAAPTLSIPSSGATGVGISPQFQLRTTDADNDYLQYEVQVCSTSNCSSIVSTSCQFTDAVTGCTGSQIGWLGQDQQTGTAYTGSSTIGSSTLATYFYQPSPLSLNTQYWWRAYAIDPGGSNTRSSASTISTFTTDAPPATPTLLTPSSGATGISTSPSFTLSTSDADSDFVQYRIYLYQSNCSTAVGSSPFAEASSQTGWSGQDANGGLAYATTPSSGTTATYTYQGTLANNTTYCWKADAIDPSGSGTYSSVSSTQLFTTASGSQVNIGGGVNINGGTSIQ